MMADKIVRISFMTSILLVLFGCSSPHSGKKAQTDMNAKNQYGIIDAHNHDASANRYKSSMRMWDKYDIHKVILFGNISEPNAIHTDDLAFAAYLKYPGRIIPFIAGINIFDQECLTYISRRFEAGVRGIGEIVAASEVSPMTSKLPWKGKNALDGFLPQIYELCGEYGKPILLHIDPPNGYQIQILTTAATSHPNTHFIFAHANAYTSPEIIENILTATDNVYMDFFAGFTAYNKDSAYKLEDFVPLIEAFPERFIVSTDSGYAVGYDKAYAAIIQLLDFLRSETAEKVAHGNIESLLAR
jgi:predicted TIM-barrel fold metal-dependent hydrolase